MARFCVNCGTELKEDADLCLNCGKLVKAPADPAITFINQPFPSLERKAGLPGTYLFSLLSALSMVCVFIFYATAVFQAWVNADYGYFWIGQDQYIALVFQFLALTFGMLGFLFSFPERKKARISLGGRLVSLFFFIAPILMLYMLFVANLYQR